MQDKTSPDEFFDNLQDFSTIFSESLAEDDLPSVIEQELTEVTDRYIDENQIDKGGMKSISSVTDKMTLREVAIAKLLKTTNKSKERFISEGRLTAFLEHPNIVPVYDLGMDGDEPFFTMKLIEGESLEDLIRDLKNNPDRCSIADRMQIFLKICDAVSYAHFKGVIHLDLKPANIQIGKFGEVIVCDWGLAKIIKDQSESRDFDTLDPDIYNDVTLNGMIKGSPGYMAPEQILEKRGSKDEQTDIYSLGGILYSLLTLKPPVNTDELKRSLQFTLEGAILDPQKIDSSIPAGLSAVAMKALSVEKSGRYKEVTEIRKEVNRWLNGFVTEAENAGFLTSLYLFVKRHKISCYFSAAILMISMISAAIFVIQENQTLEAQALYLQEKEKARIDAKNTVPILLEQANGAIMRDVDLDEALRSVNLAMEKGSENRDLWSLKGKVHFIRQEFKEAEMALSKAPDSDRAAWMRPLLPKLISMKQENELLSLESMEWFMEQISDKGYVYPICMYAASKASTLDEAFKISMLSVKHFRLNSAVKDWSYNYEVTGETLSVDLSSLSKLRSIKGLEFLPIRELNISGTDVMYNDEILKLPLEYIDISNSKIIDPLSIFRMRTLKKISIAENQYPNIKLPKRKLIIKK